eukprot:scaffold2536_cov169-Amphora_coffeaeformis.AAC.35
MGILLRITGGVRCALVGNKYISKRFGRHPAFKVVSSVSRGIHCSSRPGRVQHCFSLGHNNCPSGRQCHPRNVGTTTSNEDNGETGTSLSLLEKEIHRSLCSCISPLVNKAPKEVVLVVGVSGGCDSVGLFHGLLRVLSVHGNIANSRVLCCGERRLPCSVHVAHFDHQLRGSESDGDRMFVEELCKHHGVPFHCFYWARDSSIEETVKFSQDTARLWRRSCTSDLVRQLASDEKVPGFILTAHHADDSLESMLLKLLRGAHITNIKGMDPVTKDSDGNYILRPCLGLHKKEIIEYLLGRKLTWREDSSNISNKYLRNKVRNELIPLLSELVGGDEILEKRAENLSRQSKQVREDLHTRAIEYLQATNSTGCFTLPLSKFGFVHKEALYIWLQDRCGGFQLTYEHLERICDQVTEFPDSREWTLNLGRGCDIVREGSILRLLTESDDPRESDVIEVEWRVVSEEGSLNDKIPDGVEFSVAKGLWQELKGIFISKVRDENLHFTPSWRKGRSPTATTEFLRGQKVPLHQRRDALIIYILCNDGRKFAAAVEVPTKEKWVFDASVVPDPQADETKRVFVVLPDHYKSFH